MTDRSKPKIRDAVLLKMLKTPPKPHGDDGIDELATELSREAPDLEKLARLSGQTDSNENFGKKPKK